MKLTETALQRLNTVDNRNKLAGFLAVTEQSVIRYITNNVEDGPLTRPYSLPFICKLISLKESEVLIRENATA